MKTLPTTLLQIFCKIIPVSKVIIKSIIDAGNDYPEKLVSINGLNVGTTTNARNTRRNNEQINSFQDTFINV